MSHSRCCFHLFTCIASELETIILPILQKKKPKLREVTVDFVKVTQRLSGPSRQPDCGPDVFHTRLYRPCTQSTLYGKEAPARCRLGTSVRGPLACQKATNLERTGLMNLTPKLSLQNAKQ